MNALTPAQPPADAGAGVGALSVERVTRVSLALVWVYEGLDPKILFAAPQEIDLVARSGLYWGTPHATLVFIGACEIVGGLWLLSGRATRLAAALSAALLLAAGVACAALEPALLRHPFGALSKNLGLLACAAAVYRLAPFRESARKPSRGRFPPTKEVV